MVGMICGKVSFKTGVKKRINDYKNDDLERAAW